METIKTTLFIHEGYNGKPFVAVGDMSVIGFTLLGTHEAEIPVPATNAVQAEIESLNKQAFMIETNAVNKVIDLRRKAEDLRRSQDERG